MAFSQQHFKWFDQTATSHELDLAAKGYREKYTETTWTPQEMAQWKQKAAWCASLADRKRQGRA